MDRQDLFSYLKGQIDTCASIQFVADAPFPEPVAKKARVGEAVRQQHVLVALTNQADWIDAPMLSVLDA